LSSFSSPGTSHEHESRSLSISSFRFHLCFQLLPSLSSIIHPLSSIFSLLPLASLLLLILRSAICHLRSRRACLLPSLLFYPILRATSFGWVPPVRSQLWIPHHRPDCLFPAGLFVCGKREAFPGCSDYPPKGQLGMPSDTATSHPFSFILQESPCQSTAKSPKIVKIADF